MKYLTNCVLLLAICLLPFSLRAQFPEYIGISQDDYAEALLFLKKHKKELHEAFPESRQRAIAVSCLFPELLRYSMIRNMAETAVLETKYIESGADAADFSIGKFQMKPSFIEKIEAHVAIDSVLQWYGSTFSYDSENEEEQRRERLDRLKDWHWQLRYYQCFIDLAAYKINHEQHTMEEQIQLSSVAYNKNFELSIEEWQKGVDEQFFPYGKNFTGTQVSYASVALDFYQKYYKTIFHH